MATGMTACLSPTYRGIFHIHGLSPDRLRPGQKQELIAEPSTGNARRLTSTLDSGLDLGQCLTLLILCAWKFLENIPVRIFLFISLSANIQPVTKLWGATCQERLVSTSATHQSTFIYLDEMEPSFPANKSQCGHPVTLQNEETSQSIPFAMQRAVLVPCSNLLDCRLGHDGLRCIL